MITDARLGPTTDTKMITSSSVGMLQDDVGEAHQHLVHRRRRSSPASAAR